MRGESTEYGEPEGALPRFEDGASVDLTTSERARVIRMRGFRPMVDNDPVDFLPVYSGEEPEAEDIVRQRAELEARTNRYNREVDPD